MRSVLTDADKRKIIGMYFGEDETSTLCTQQYIASEFGVSQSTIYNAIKHYTLDMRARIKTLEQQGVSNDEICTKLNISRHLLTSIRVYTLRYIANTFY